MSHQLGIAKRMRLKLLKTLLTKKEFSLLPFTWKGFLLESGWFDSVAKGQSIDSKGNVMPWITYPAFRFLNDRLPEGVLVFEYGAGNSTLYFGEKGAAVYSVENDKGWYQHLQTRLPYPERLHFQIVDNEHAISKYVAKIEDIGLLFDIVLIDGRHRRRCLLKAPAFLSAQGVIILDNSERVHYKEGIDSLLQQGFKRIDFWGLSPIAYKASCTSVFYREGNLLHL